MARKKIWNITRIAPRPAAGFNRLNGDYSHHHGVHLYINVDHDPDRTILAGLTADEADALGKQLQKLAADAREKTAKQKARRLAIH